MEALIVMRTSNGASKSTALSDDYSSESDKENYAIDLSRRRGQSLMGAELYHLRCCKGVSAKDLANSSRIPIDRLQGFECGDLRLETSEIGRIAKALGSTLQKVCDEANAAMSVSDEELIANARAICKQLRNGQTKSQPARRAKRKVIPTVVGA